MPKLVLRRQPVGKRRQRRPERYGARNPEGSTKDEDQELQDENKDREVGMKANSGEK